MPLPQQANLRDYWRIILKRKKPFVFIFTLIMVGALFLTKETKTEERFVATAKIAVEGAFVQVDALPGSGVVRRDPWVVLNPAFLQTQFGILKSQIVAERAIKILGWDMQNKEMLITKIKQQIAINQPGSEDGGGGSGSIISISATDTNPREAMEIANAVTQAYIELRKEERENLIGSVYIKLEEQVRAVKAKLDVSEQKVEEFKKKEGMLDLEGGADLTVQTVQQSNQRLIEIRSGIAEKETMLNTIEALMQKDSLAAIALISEKLWQSNPVNLELKQKLLGKQNELNNLLQVYKDKHPEVIRVRSELELLKQQMDNEVKGVIGGLKFNIESSRKLEQSIVDFLQKPDFGAKQAKYMDLQREVNLNKDLYTSLLRRLKEMDVTEQISDQPDVRIIEFASLPMSPLPSPKKRGKAMSPAVALIIAVMVSFLLEYLDNTIKTIEDVETYLDMPVLGVIPHVASSVKRRRGRKMKRE